MANEIKADSNTYVGYNHITSEFYVKNLDTKTAAKTATDAKLVLDITAPGNKVSLESIAQLEHRLEPITSISYTLEDTGRYIKTIYFNEYKSLSIQYDEPSLYIQGSNEMWDMSSTLSQDSVSLFMWQYFVYYVGLNMPRKLMNAIIAYYKEIQKPYVYNIVTPLTDEEKDAGKSLTYSNQFTMNNADHTSKGEYTGTKNPDNLYTLNVYDIESIKTYKTDVNGKINISDLDLETYYLKEISTLEGYILDNEYKKVELKYKDDKSNIVTENIKITNEKVKCDVVYITSSNDGTILPNVEINV